MSCRDVESALLVCSNSTKECNIFSCLASFLGLKKQKLPAGTKELLHLVFAVFLHSGINLELIF